MSVHAYIARSGWRETPISAEAWFQAVRDEPDLEAQTSSSGVPLARLRVSNRGLIRLTDGYIHAQDADEQLIEVMFRLAERLDARVYGKGPKPFVSVSDWRRRTAKARAQREAGLDWTRERASRRRRRLAGAAVLGMLVAVLLSYLR